MSCCRFVVLVCGTLVYSKGDEVQNSKAHAELEAAAAEEGEAAQPSTLMPGMELNQTNNKTVVHCDYTSCASYDRSEGHVPIVDCIYDMRPIQGSHASNDMGGQQAIMAGTM